MNAPPTFKYILILLHIQEHRWTEQLEHQIDTEKAKQKKSNFERHLKWIKCPVGGAYNTWAVSPAKE